MGFQIRNSSSLTLTRVQDSNSRLQRHSSDDHRYSSTPAAISAESSQHHLNLLASATSVATTTAVTARNNNTPSVDLSLIYTAAATPINSFITAGTSFSASPWS
ncbi:Protein SHI RELATED SEQUENCE 7 [Raphanus sativus]|nr:Protein SHI RELATED SEQUENCE 7 [Raphanus sativus]